MITTVTRPARLFCSYSHLDDEFREELELHLKALVLQGLIEFWSDRRIAPGDEWNRTISDRLEQADIIVLLISVFFINSEYCYQIELGRALKRHEEGSAVVVPVFVRACYCEGLAFWRLQGLPPDAKPVNTFQDRDSAWLLVAEGIRKVAASLSLAAQALPPSAPATPTLRQVLRYELRTYMQALVTAAEREQRAGTIELFASAAGELEPEPVIPALLRWAATSSSRAVLLTGAPGSGKTWVFHQTAGELARGVLSDRPGPLPVYVPVRSLSARMGDPLARLREVVPEAQVLLDEAREGRPVVLFMDGMDEAEVNGTGQAVRLVADLARVLPPATRFALAVRSLVASDLRMHLIAAGIGAPQYDLCDVSRDQARDFVLRSPASAAMMKWWNAPGSMPRQPILLRLQEQSAGNADTEDAPILELYTVAVEQLISRAKALAPGLDDMSAGELIGLLAWVTAVMYPGTTTTLSQLITSGNLPPDRWSEILNNLAAAGLVIVDSREVVSFSHASFFDYFFARLLLGQMRRFDAWHLSRTNLIYSYNVNRFLVPLLLREERGTPSPRAWPVRERLRNSTDGPVLVTSADFLEFMADTGWRGETGFGSWITVRAPDGTAAASERSIIPESTRGPGKVGKAAAVSGVSWYDAQQFARWVGGRLPSADLGDDVSPNGPRMLWTADWYEESASLIAVWRGNDRIGVNPDVRHADLGVAVVLKP